jgi:uncharacterized protein (DUF1778 family)
LQRKIYSGDHYEYVAQYCRKGDEFMQKEHMTLNVEISEQEYSVIKAFADFEGETMTSFILRAIREKMEEWEDVQDAEEILARNEPTVSWEDVQRKAGIYV